MNNKESKPIISICIPTRNRCKYLKTNILSIVNQQEFKDGLVEVIVVDNASSDDTQKEMMILVKEYGIIYKRNEFNIGSEANYRLAISMASSCFIKLINDSIVFLNNSLKEIVNLIEIYGDSKPQVYFSNRDKNELLLLKFSDFVFMETYKITDLSTLSLWNEDKDLVIGDTSSDKSRLWCANSSLKLSKHKENILLVNRKLFKRQQLEIKIFDYPLFQVFYTSFLELIKKYLYYSDDRFNEMVYEHVEKKLFFDFFCTWVYNYDVRNTSYSKYKFLYDENLHNKVFEHCKTKVYYIPWLIKYYLYILKMRLKGFVKKGII